METKNIICSHKTIDIYYRLLKSLSLCSRILPECVLVLLQVHSEPQSHSLATPVKEQKCFFPAVWKCTWGRFVKKEFTWFHIESGASTDSRAPTTGLEWRCHSEPAMQSCCRWPPRWPSATCPSASDAPRRWGQSFHRVLGRYSSVGSHRGTQSRPKSDTQTHEN